MPIHPCTAAPGVTGDLTSDWRWQHVRSLAQADLKFPNAGVARQLRRAAAPAPGGTGIDPLKVDLRLAPGAGTAPWSRIAPVVASHTAPLLLEVQPQRRPALGRLQGKAAALLTRAAAEREAA